MKTLILSVSFCVLCALCGCQSSGPGPDGRLAPLPIDYYAE